MHWAIWERTHTFKNLAPREETHKLCRILKAFVLVYGRSLSSIKILDDENQDDMIKRLKIITKPFVYIKLKASRLWRRWRKAANGPIRYIKGRPRIIFLFDKTHGSARGYIDLSDWKIPDLHVFKAIILNRPPPSIKRETPWSLQTDGEWKEL